MLIIHKELVIDLTVVTVAAMPTGTVHAALTSPNQGSVTGRRLFSMVLSQDCLMTHTATRVEFSL